jgi:hypothetical protein
MKVTHHRGGVLDARPLPELSGIEAAIFDRVGRVAQREVLRIRPGVRRLSLEFPGSGGSLDAYMTARSVVAWMHGGSPTVLRSTWRVPEGATARLDLCALAGHGVAELSLSRMDCGADEVGTLTADGQPIVRVLPAGLYTLRAWAFEGQAALRAELG